MEVRERCMWLNKTELPSYSHALGFGRLPFGFSIEGDHHNEGSCRQESLPQPLLRPIITIKAAKSHTRMQVQNIGPTQNAKVLKGNRLGQQAIIESIEERK